MLILSLFVGLQVQNGTKLMKLPVLSNHLYILSLYFIPLQHSLYSILAVHTSEQQQQRPFNGL